MLHTGLISAATKTNNLKLLSTVTNCLRFLLDELVCENKPINRLILLSLEVSMFGIGGCACAVTSLHASWSEPDTYN